MRPAPKCVLDRSRPCTACIAPDPQSCPYPYLLADADPPEPAAPDGPEAGLPDDGSIGDGGPDDRGGPGR